MKTLGTLQFKGNAFTLGELPPWSRYTLHYANEELHYPMNAGEIVCQRYHFHPTGNERLWFNPFIIDLTQIQQKCDATIPFSIEERQLLVSFVLDGSVLINSKDEQLSLAHNTFQFCMLGPGDYYLELPAGHHTVLIINIDLAWLNKFFKKEKVVREIVRQFKSGEQHFQVSPPCRMSPIIREWLSDLYNYSENRFPIIDANLRLSLSQILVYYNKINTAGEFNLAEEIKLYIDQNYNNPNLNVKMLAEMFNGSRQKLRDHFKRKYGLNISEYYTHVRIKHARYAIRYWRSSVTEVYESVGYRSASSLSYVLKKSGYRRQSGRYEE